MASWSATKCGLVVGSALLALGLGWPRPANAQDVARDFTAIGSGRTIIVVDDSGRETKGHLLRVTSESLTMTVSGEDRVFDRQHVRAIYERGDSLANGALIGFAAGFVLGSSGSDRYTSSGGLGFIIGGMGAAVGAGIDAMIIRRHLIYEGPQRPGVPRISIRPSLAPSGARVLFGMRW